MVSVITTASKIIVHGLTHNLPWSTCPMWAAVGDKAPSQVHMLLPSEHKLQIVDTKNKRVQMESSSDTCSHPEGVRVRLVHLPDLIPLAIDIIFGDLVALRMAIHVPFGHGLIASSVY